MHRRGFTILELLLALSLAGLAVGTIAGIYGVMGAANTKATERFTSAAERMQTYDILQLTMTGLVAATPITPDAGAASEESDGAETASRVLDRPGSAGTLSDGGGGGVFTAQSGRGTPVMFELSWVEVASEVVVQRLELVTLAPPVKYELLPDEELLVAPSPEERERWKTPDRVRSAFEFENNNGRWDLVWRPLDPPGYAVPIIEGVRFAQWEVLMRSKLDSASAARSQEAWVDIAASFLGEDFPIAVKLVYETESGIEADYVFETLVTTRSY